MLCLATVWAGSPLQPSIRPALLEIGPPSDYSELANIACNEDRSMEDTIDELRQLAASVPNLDATAEQRRIWMDMVWHYTQRFYGGLEHADVYTPTEHRLCALEDLEIPDEARDLAVLLDVLKDSVDGPGINPASPRHLGYIPGGGLFAGALGDFLAAVTNRYAGIHYASPGAVKLEHLLVRWLCKLAGFPEDSVGHLSSGGSIATLTAVVAARDHRLVQPEMFGRSCVYITQQVHHCVLKALRIAGLSHAIVRHVPMLPNYQMDVVALQRMIEADVQEDLHPFLIVASAGSTDLGIIDPLDAMAIIAQSYDCWFHVDAAYGGFFMLCPEAKTLFRGIEQADSLVLDPHKGLFLSYGTGAVLIKKREAVFQSNLYVANYMKDAYDRDPVINPADVSPELTKHFRSLRMWLSLQLIGVDAFRLQIGEKLQLTRFFYDRVASLGFQTGPEPQLTVVLFRWTTGGGTAIDNAINHKIQDAILDSRQIFLTTTTLADIVWLRICILCHRTHIVHIETLLAMLADEVKRLREPVA